MSGNKNFTRNSLMRIYKSGHILQQSLPYAGDFEKIYCKWTRHNQTQLIKGTVTM